MQPIVFVIASILIVFALVYLALIRTWQLRSIYRDLKKRVAYLLDTKNGEARDEQQQEQDQQQPAAAPEHGPIDVIEDPAKVNRAQANRWVRDFDSWDICDQVCGEVFPYIPFAIEKAHEWTARRAEFVKRAGFVLMARMAVRRKDLADGVFLEFLPLIRREATDDRNFVRKAVNWALRQIGKRNPRLRRAAIAEAKAIAKLDSRAARWIAVDALRELQKAKT